MKSDYPVELESQFILRMPEEPAKALKEALATGENFKNRLTIQIDNDMRRGEVRFDHWLLHGKIVDLPTIVESLKTIDRKSLYKTADICQMMICSNEMEPVATEEESQKNKKKDSYKVDKKFLWPHGITPPTKNVRKRRFRKTLKKKSAEAPEIEKEVKRLLRADNEAVSITWEVVKEEDEQQHKSEQSTIKPDRKVKKEIAMKKESIAQSSSKVEDIFGGALSDSDLEEENIDVDSHMSFDEHISDFSAQGMAELKDNQFDTQFHSEMFSLTPDRPSTSKDYMMSSSTKVIEGIDSPELAQSKDKNNLHLKLHKLSTELEDLKQRKQRTQLEILGMENMTLKQRFQDILQTLNKDIMIKEKKYQSLKNLLN